MDAPRPKSSRSAALKLSRGPRETVARAPRLLEIRTWLVESPQCELDVRASGAESSAANGFQVISVSFTDPSLDFARVASLARSLARRIGKGLH